MRTTTSNLPFNYKTITLTQSRIAKGLLAIPVTLIDSFPKKRTLVDVFEGDGGTSSPKTFTPYKSSSGECRIGGMREFYKRFRLRGGDEIVLQVLPDGKYRFMTEAQFENTVNRIEKDFDSSKTEDIAAAKLALLSTITNTRPTETVLSEYFRLAETEPNARKLRIAKTRGVRETAPASIRELLIGIYGGRCQVTGFGFRKQNGKPYFEIHHIRRELGDHLKNVLVVSPNTHAQFTYAFVEHYFDAQGWLRKVQFNGSVFEVRQAIDKIPRRYQKEVHCEA